MRKFVSGPGLGSIPRSSPKVADIAYRTIEFVFQHIEVWRQFLSGRMPCMMAHGCNPVTVKTVGNAKAGVWQKIGC